VCLLCNTYKGLGRVAIPCGRTVPCIAQVRPQSDGDTRGFPNAASASQRGLYGHIYIPAVRYANPTIHVLVVPAMPWPNEPKPDTL
jgi:hypothetical protein